MLATGAFFVLYDTPTKVKKWLRPEEQRYLILRHRYGAGGETGVAEKEEFSWKAVKDAFTVLLVSMPLRGTKANDSIFSLSTSMLCSSDPKPESKDGIIN